MPLYGIASALHGTEALHWTTSTVVAHGADRIVLGGVWREDVDPGNPDALRATVERFVLSVRGAVALRVGEAVVPVVYCTQDGPCIPDVETALGVSSVSAHIEATIGTLVDRAAIEFHPRGYQPRAFGCDVRVRKRDATVEDRARERRNIHLRDLYLKAGRDPEGEAMLRLETYVDVLAERYAERYRQSGWDASTRFFLLGSHVPERKDDVQYNMIRWFDFRRRFAQRLIDALAIDHCICVKAPLDPPSPPTADITATYLADKLAKRPALAMVAHGGVYGGEQTKCV